MPAPTILITGPRASGKTRFAVKLMEHYGCTRVVDEWPHSRKDMVPGALHLAAKGHNTTKQKGLTFVPGYVTIDIADALKAAGLLPVKVVK